MPNKNYYTQRQWDRVVGYGKVPDKYKLKEKRYPDKKSEPRLRPTTTGKIKLGDQVGEILVRGKPHPVYEFINVYQEGGSIIASNPYGNYEPRGI